MDDKKKRPTRRANFISVNTTQEISFIRIEDIVRLEANSNYTFIFLAGNKKILSSKNLMEFEQVLSPYNFLRVHKSHLVNAQYISHFDKKGKGLLHLKNNYKLQVSDAGKTKFLSFFKKHSINV